MRKTETLERRRAAAALAYARSHPAHVANGEEERYRAARSPMTFTKGLPHRQCDGLVADATDPQRFRAAIDDGRVARFDLDVPLGGHAVAPEGPVFTWHFHGDDGPGRAHLGARTPDAQYRRWEAPTAGFVHDLQGPDAQAVTMPPAPVMVGAQSHFGAADDELVAEMAEVYWLALLRDEPFAHFDASSGAAAPNLDAAISHLAGLPFYGRAVGDAPRRRLLAGETLDRQTAFRGHTPGDRKGPYLSQFMVMGNRHLGDNAGRTEADGYVQYGSISIDQRVRVATPELDYMTHWHEWLDVQNGADVISVQDYVDPTPGPGFRFIARPRDLATYVHFDALYEAYLNACLWLLSAEAPVDPNFLVQLNRSRHTQGFALFGGPHILSLLTEVATRGLKAVRFQKFNVHLRLRPEALAGRVVAAAADVVGGSGDERDVPAAARQDLDRFYAALAAPVNGVDLLARICTHNAAQNARHAAYLGLQSGLAAQANLPLLPMAFPEGSPMHPTYGAGHATVAGACVTLLKAFFDEDACLVRDTTKATATDPGVVRVVPAGEVTTDHVPVAFVPSVDGAVLNDVGASLGGFLRLGDELDKLAANISIGRNMAGVHFYSDYIDSLRLGEAVALGLLEEQSLMYPKDPFRIALTTFDGVRTIVADGTVQAVSSGGSGR